MGADKPSKPERSALQALEQGKGVCQDFAHLAIASLRSLGLAARYVSGYLRTVPPPGKERLAGADAMHAWVAVWCGPGHGWVEIDPTNARFAGNGARKQGLTCSRRPNQ